MQGTAPPPHSIEFEEVLLGTLLSDAQAANDIATIFPEGNLYVPKHELIYEIILDLAREGKPANVLTVHDRVQSEGLSEKIGGAYYLTHLAEKAQAASSIEYYAKGLLEYAMRRKSYRLFMEAAKNSHDMTIDIFETFDESQQQLFDLEQGVGRTGTVVNMSAAIDTAYNHLQSVHGAEDGITGIGTGFHKLDAITGGWQNGDFIIIAARPSMGKTALALCMARNGWVEYGVPVGMFSFEMNNRSLAQRVLTAEARVDATAARTGRLTDADWKQLDEARKKLAGIEIFLDDSSDSSIGYVVSRARKMVRDGAKAIIIDYLQLMMATAGNREQEIAKIARALKQLALELDVPIIALSQLSRRVENREDKRPNLADLRESGAIEQDADVVAFVYRAERYDIMVDENGNSTEGTGQIIVGKHRNGSLGVVTLAFIDKYARFENLTTHYEADEYNFDQIEMDTSNSNEINWQ